jgi:hypothetical protein
MIIYISGKERGGKRGTHSGGCPITPDCYLCKFSGCRSFSDGSYRLQGVTPEDIETIKKRAIISHVIKENGE